MKRKLLQENFQDASNVNGAGSIVPDPVVVGDTHANRPLDNPAQTDADVAVAPGVGVIPRAAMIQAIVQMLAGMNDIDIQQIVDMSGIDLAAAPASGVADNNAATNMASVQGNGIPMKEEIEDIFKGSDYSEEFKERAAVIFEAAVNTRLEVAKQFLKEESEKQTKEGLATIAESMAEALDSHTTFIAEQKVEQMNESINESVQSIVAQQFMVEIFGVMSKYNVNIPERSLDVVGDLEKQIETLKEEMVAIRDNEIKLVNENLTYKKSSLIEDLSTTMTPLQRSKFKSLTENISYSSFDDFSQKVKILAENAIAEKKPANNLISEENNGIAPLETSVTIVKDKSSTSSITSALDKVLGG